jgi:hypothetical protein
LINTLGASYRKCSYLRFGGKFNVCATEKKENVC